jgi:hypothetical protein
METLQWTLAQFLLIQSLPVPVDTAFLHHLPVGSFPADSSFAHHPAVLYAQSQLAYDKSKEDVLKKSFLPKLSVWGTAFGRGTGFENNGTIKTWEGMGLSKYNYGTGLQLTFPIIKYYESKRQINEQTLLSQASEQRIANTENSLYYQQQINITLLIIVWRSPVSLSRKWPPHSMPSTPWIPAMKRASLIFPISSKLSIIC